ncbi:MAG: hypothetical protein J5U17_10480 [Candidatus Methanoperedens sp.]|nr:hypothetical protein [Candidatus Methanoperedens sp.]
MPIAKYIPVCLLFLLITVLSGCVDKNDQYPLHKDITVTFFWIGEEGTDENSYIPNSQSAWDSNWKDHYGGIDDPHNRNGFYPKNFTPKENPFYFALPYNDFDNNGSRRSSENESIYKNRWIKIVKGNKIAYAQWEDVGPFEEDDVDYVFGTSKPKNKINNAGLDVSPAVRDYLGLEDIDIVDWQFVDFKDVPNSYWTEIITRSQISW